MSSLVSRIVRNVTNSPQQVVAPPGTKRLRVRYVDSGVAGHLRVCLEAASLNDATHRLVLTGAHFAIASQQEVPDLSFSGAPEIYIRTDSAIGAGSNTLILLFESD